MRNNKFNFYSPPSNPSTDNLLFAIAIIQRKIHLSTINQLTYTFAFAFIVFLLASNVCCRFTYNRALLLCSISVAFIQFLLSIALCMNECNACVATSFYLRYSKCVWQQLLLLFVCFFCFLILLLCFCGFLDLLMIWWCFLRSLCFFFLFCIFDASLYIWFLGR